MIEVPFSKDHQRNSERHQIPDAYPCIVCGKPCPNPRHMVRLFYGGTIVTDAEAEAIIAKEGHGGDMSYYPLGGDCLRKNPDLKPYAIAVGGEAARLAACEPIDAATAAATNKEWWRQCENPGRP